MLDSHKIAFITKTVRFNKKKHFVKDWMTSSILKSVNYKNKLYKTLILSKNNANLYASLKINLILIKKRFTIFSSFLSIKTIYQKHGMS